MAMVAGGDACLGGCFVDPYPPSWRCGDCGHAWKDDTDPAQQMLDESERRFRVRMQELRKAKGL